MLDAPRTSSNHPGPGRFAELYLIAMAAVLCLRVITGIGVEVKTEEFAERCQKKIHFQIDRGCAVAPRAGAWIETRIECRNASMSGVAPRAGAWIETTMNHSLSSSGKGRPPRGGVD